MGSEMCIRDSQPQFEAALVGVHAENGASVTAADALRSCLEPFVVAQVFGFCSYFMVPPQAVGTALEMILRMSCDIRRFVQPSVFR